MIGDALIAQSQKEVQTFWRIREGHALDRLPLLLNFDVSLPIGEIGRFADECGKALRAKFPEAHVSFFGHVGDSNLHIAFPFRAQPRKRRTRSTPSSTDWSASIAARYRPSTGSAS